MLERAAVILKEKKVKTSLENLEQYIDYCYPDFRKLLETLDQNSFDGNLSDF